jgi:hypothetical protein
MYIGNYLGLVHESEKQLTEAFTKVAEHHGAEPDIYQTCKLLASWSQKHIEKLLPFVQKYSEDKSHEPDRLNQVLFKEPRKGSLALIRDLHDLYLLAQEVQLCWIVLLQAAQGLRDYKLKGECENFSAETKRQISWLMTRIKQAAPQSLIAAE